MTMQANIQNLTEYILINYKKYKISAVELIDHTPDEIQLALTFKSNKVIVCLINFGSYVHIEGSVIEISDQELSSYVSDSLDNNQFNCWYENFQADSFNDLNSIVCEIINQCDIYNTTELIKSLNKIKLQLDSCREKYEYNNIDIILKDFLKSYVYDL